VTFTFEGPEQLSRLSTFFRIILMIPVLLFIAVLSGGGSYTRSTGASEAVAVGGGAFSGLVGAYLISAFVRGGRPVGWLGSVIVSIQRFQLRAYTYILLLADKYPAFEGEWFAQYEAQRPERISRWQMVIWKTLTAIPHFIVLTVLFFAVAVCEVIAWFAILFTGRFPRGMRDFVVGWLRWSARVTAYVISLRDEFPPYSLSHYAGPGSSRAKLWSGLGGIAILVVGGASVAALFLALAGSESADVSYTRLTSGTPSSTIEAGNIEVTLTSADDSYDFPNDLFLADTGKRFVEFEITLVNNRTTDMDVEIDDFELDDSGGDTHEAAFLSLGGALPPRSLGDGQTGAAIAIFEVPSDTDPEKLTYLPSGSLKRAEFVFN
jgi:hypothetical protein